MGGISPTAETSVAPLQRICGWGSMCYGDPPPPTLTHTCTAEAGSCVSGWVGVCCRYVLMKHWLHHSQDLGDGPLPLQVPTFPREDESPLTHPNQEVLLPESLPLILPGSFSLFLCLNSFPIYIAHNQHSHKPWPCIFSMPGPETPKRHLLCPGVTQASNGEASQ